MYSSTVMAGKVALLLFFPLFYHPHLLDANAMTFEYCLVFRGSCQTQCDASTFSLRGDSWCFSGKTCCLKIITPSPTPAPKPSCGISGPRRLLKGKIVGGEEANRCEFPWMVNIDVNPDGVHPCGGAVIDNRHVLTAAHCYTGGGIAGSYVPVLTIGEYNKSQQDSAQKFSTNNYTIFRHPAYMPSTYFNDILIIRLHSPVDFSQYRCIQPLCLPEEDADFPIGTECIVSGWGVTDPNYDILNPSTPNVLMKVTLPLVNETLCQNQFQQYFNASTELCAGQLEGNKDSCDGDSGGPLMCRTGNGNEYYAAGIVSAGAKCAQRNTPAIYTNVRYFLPWIRSIIGSGK